MQAFKQILFTGWNFMRWLRLILGIIIAAQGIKLHDAVSGFIGEFFLFQALSNTGCCGMGACSVPLNTRKTDAAEDTAFEEIK